MDSLLERIEENRLDALYLFINEPLRERQTYDRFFESLVAVLPQNWSIQRVEFGHEFLSMARNGQQQQIFDIVAGLEGIRTLIISDGYVPRKDTGSADTTALLTALPKARNLVNLDFQRLQLATEDQVDMLADVFVTLKESLEEIRITGLFLGDEVPSLDAVIESCTDMSNLRSLSISTTFESQNKARQLISIQCLQELCQNSTTLQDLSLRAMHLDDEQCRTIAGALTTSSFLTSLDIRQNSKVGEEGYLAILHALERNYDLWCSVMVDNESFQGKFNSLIELNQANRGDLLRHPTREKLINFLDNLKDDPTAVWYFLTIHDSILYPLLDFLRWKERRQITTSQAQKRENDQSSAAVPQKKPRTEP